MKRILFLLIVLPALMMAQPVLKPGIGLSSLPADGDVTCTIPWYLGSFDSSGLQVGDTAFDFKLYSLNGDSFVLSEKLGQGKPVLLVSGSYTCPVFRNKLDELNAIAAAYAGQLEVAIVYAVEAHPTDISPYFGYVNVNQANQNQGILYPQPGTYGERKAICSDLLQNETVSVPVYLDGPCNVWWSVYGPAPNNAYLIDTTGIVFAKHGWFDRHPDHDMVCDIDSLLNSVSCTPPAGGGSFTVQLVDPVITGNAGDVLYAHATIINTTANYVNIGVKKQQSNLPAGWQSAFCFQVCFSPSEDSITIQVAPYDTADFSTDFFTSSLSADSGSVKVGFRNTDNLANSFSVTFRAYTTDLVSSMDPASTEEGSFSLYPNPSKDNAELVTAASLVNKEIEIWDMQGKLLQKQTINAPRIALQTGNLACGVYLIRIGEVQKKWVKM
jgi:hypothetical protein